MSNLFFPFTFLGTKQIWAWALNFAFWCLKWFDQSIKKFINSNLKEVFQEFQNVRSTISFIKEVNCFLTGILIRILEEFFQNSVSQIDKISRIVFPLAFALLNGCYWFNYLKVSARIDSFLLAKFYKPTWTKTTKFQVASLIEIWWFWSCIGKSQDSFLHVRKQVLAFFSF